MRSRCCSTVSWLLLLTAACSSGEYSLERRGGPFPTEPVVDPPVGDNEGDAGSGASGGAEGEAAAGVGADGGAAGAAPEPERIRFCAALTVVRAKCQRCHTDPPQNGAPVPFLTYEDFHEVYFDTVLWWQRAQSVVEIDYMPFVQLNEPPTSIMPPVQPLTADEKATLLGWFEQGALPEGGTDCP